MNDQLRQRIHLDCLKNKDKLKRYSKSNSELLDKTRVVFLNDHFVTISSILPSDLVGVESIEECKAMLSRKTKYGTSIISQKKLFQLGAFVDIYQYITSRKEVTILGIATTSGLLGSIFGSQRTVSTVLNLAVEVGLINVIDSSYHFGDDKARAKRYAWNKKVQDIVKDVVKEYINEEYKSKLEEVRSGRSTASSVEIEAEILEDAHEKVKSSSKKNCGVNFGGFSSKLRLPSIITDKEALALLYEKFPQLSYYQDLAAEMNTNLTLENQIKFVPKIHRSANGFITKISIRATCQVASLKKSGKSGDSNDVISSMTREEYLNTRFGEGNYGEFDVKSSIYRINKLLRHGIWLHNDIDIYELMYMNQFQSKFERDSYKSFCMRLYFDNPGSVIHHISGAIDETINDFGFNEVKNEIKNMREDMEIIIGQTMDNEIFFHESCIYLDVVKRLRDMGLDVVQVYDGFYFSGEGYKSTDIASIIKECALAYYDKYIKNPQKHDKLCLPKIAKIEVDRDISDEKQEIVNG